jgi:hypothetical protein
MHVMPALSRKSIKIIIFVFYSKLENDVKYLGLSNLYRSQQFEKAF